MTLTRNLLFLRNALPARIGDVPLLSPDAFRGTILDAVANELRVVSLFAREAGSRVELVAVLANDAPGQLGIARTQLTTEHWDSLTPDCPQVHLFEREIAEQFGIRMYGHPWLKRVRFEKPLRAGATVFKDEPVAGVTDFFRVEGEEVHEVAVGPVHAGVIEPGTSASNAMAKRSSTSRSHSGTSTAGSSAR